MHKTLSLFVLKLQKDFSAFCGRKLQEIGLTQGLLYFIIYVGKHPGCSTKDLIKDLNMDWGHAQRSIEKLVRDGFMVKEKNAHDKRAYSLTLSSKGDNAFLVSHQVFTLWDETVLKDLPEEEKDRLFFILEKLVHFKGDDVCVRNNEMPH